MTLRLITAPTGMAVSLAQAKEHLRVDTIIEDALITAMILTATDTAEQVTGRALMTQTYEAGFNSFPPISYRGRTSSTIRLTRAPVQSVTSIKYLDASAVLQTISPALYTVTFDDVCGPVINPAYGTAWPDALDATDSVLITYVAGYASDALVPQAIKNWILLRVGSTYENRESEVEMRGSSVQMAFADKLLDRYRVTNYAA